MVRLIIILFFIIIGLLLALKASVWQKKQVDVLKSQKKMIAHTPILGHIFSAILASQIYVMGSSFGVWFYRLLGSAFVLLGIELWVFT